MDCKIYVDTDLDICYSRRLLRDIVERGRDLEGIIKQWDDFVKPNSVRFVKPTMNSADVVIPRGSDNIIAIDMIIQHIRKQLHSKSIEHVQQLKKLGKVIKPIDKSKVHVLPKTNQLLGIKTILLNKDTTNDEFIFYFNRIATILIYASLELVQYTPLPPSGHPVISPTGHRIPDPVFQNETVVGVDIIRSGDCFIPSLRKTIPEVMLGKLLIQSDSLTGEPQLFTERLPPHLDRPNLRALLFDAQTISGSAAIMAIKVLIDHGVEQSKIVLVTYLATSAGVRRILNVFPKVNIVIGSLSKEHGDDGGEGGLSCGLVTMDQDGDWWMNNRFIDSRYFGTD
ncbi:unnamed protein product [Ambrosiozyma monospora]|uniref:Unnamed protein product n=1 Tax=Ambrosiozyma monospora TaxID=43982 RepID=A0A9W6YYT3_AMBMO|nr:unnamed protein product [Ambrosiozyma monospora]